MASEGNEIVVGPADSIPVGGVKLLPIGRYGVGVYNVGGTLHALANYCPHRGGPLCRGTLTGMTEPGERPYEVRWVREGEIVRCPWHGWEFDVATGESVSGPTRRVRSYPVAIRDGQIVLTVPDSMRVSGAGASNEQEVTA